MVIEADGWKEIDIDFTQVCRIVDHIRENSGFQIYAEHGVAETRHFSEWRCSILGVPLTLRKDLNRDPPALDIYALSEGREWGVIFHFIRLYTGSFSIGDQVGKIIVDKTCFYGSFERFQTVFMIVKMAGS